MKNIIEECYLNMENKEKIFAVYSDINSEDKKLTYGEIKNTIIATTSSIIAIGIRELVIGPFVLNPLTIESAGAGAVASAIPPNIIDKYSGIFKI